MEISGERVKLTSSEAAWVQVKGMYSSSSMPTLVSKIHRARHALALTQGVECTRHVTPEAAQAELSVRLLLLSESLAFSEAEAVYGVNPDGSERHIIEITMSDDEKAAVLRNARTAHVTSRETVTNFSAYEGGVRYNMQDITEISDAFNLLTPKEIEGQRDLDNDPALHETLEEISFVDNLHELNVTSGIIRAIEADQLRS